VTTGWPARSPQWYTAAIVAVPSIVNLVPPRGPTAGRNLVQVYGDGFRLPAVPDVVPAPPVPQTVQVLFGDEAVEDVRVLRSNRLLVNAPISPVAAVRVRMAGTPDLTFTPGGAPTVTRDAGSWVTDGFRAGQRVRVVGSTSNDNGPKTEYLIAVVSALVLTLDPAVTLAAEGPTSGVSVVSYAYGEGRVDITIRNLDDLGDPIVGEEVVVPDAYLYERVQLATQSCLVHVVRSLIREVRRQVIANVSLTTHTDWDGESEDLLQLVNLAEVPGIALLGPDLPENRFYSVNGTVEQVQSDDTVLLRNAPHTVDLEFDVLLVTDSKIELLNLSALWTQFMHRNPYLTVARDPDDPSKGRVRYEFDVTTGGDLLAGKAPNNSNLRTATGSVVVRGFDLEDLAGFTDEAARDLTGMTEDVDDPVTVGVSQTGVSYRVGPGPGGGKC